MSAAKRNSASVLTAWVGRFWAWLIGPARPAGVLLLCVLFIAFGTYWAWLKLRSRIQAADEYRIGPEHIKLIPSLPSWIHRDLCKEVFHDAALDGSLNILDKNLCERITQAFAQHPWVGKVERVSKRLPATVEVELIYRRPVCMVEVSGGLLPVDEEGVLLPSSDFTPTEAVRYPRLTGVGQAPPVSPGRRWHDARVIGGAELAAQLFDDWQRLQLRRIVPLSHPPPAGENLGREASGEPFFVLITRGGSKILWGYAPGANMLGELPPGEKKARLLHYLAEHNSLEGRDGKPQELDVRKLPTPPLH